MNNTEKSYKKLPPFKGWVLQNFPFIEEDFDAITNYQMMCKVIEYLKVIQNNVDYIQDEEFTPLYNAFVELKNYVDNYFENLDIQTEVNNKLDEMAESGQLADIIAQYLEVASVLGFDTKSALKSAENLVEGSITRTLGRDSYNDGYGYYYKIRTLTSGDIIDDDNILALTNYPTLIAEKIVNYNAISDIAKDNISLMSELNFDTVSDMKSATNLVVGSLVQTAGYYNVNDGGDSLYKIREIEEEETPDEMTVIALRDENLVAELVLKYPINPIKLGAKANGTDDDSQYIQKAIDLGNVKLERKTFKVDSTLTVNGNKTINLNRATLIGNANPFFKINETNATSPLTWITIKNGKIETSGNGIEVYNSYFVKIEDITVKLLQALGTGIYFENGFNNTFNNLQIYGIDTNYNIGVEYNMVQNSNIVGINNITNIQFNSCLIQRVRTGIKVHGVSGGSFDSNVMINNGFSFCSDYCIEFGTNSGNWEIINTRAEYNEKFMNIVNNNYVNVQGLYLLDSKGIDNAGTLEMSGNIYHMSDDNISRNTILSNSGAINFGSIGNWGNNGTIICDNSTKNSVMTASTKRLYTQAINLFFPQYINVKYTGNSSYTVSAIQGSEGGEMYLLRREGDAGWLLPNGTYTTAGVLYHLIFLNGEWHII